ncbi:MAG: P-loop NTPase fold protein, partial [bacterium]
MNQERVLDDQAAGRAADKLGFQRYVEAIDEKVFKREETAPFVVGVYGRWGSGKSSLLAMLKEWLEEAVRRDAWEVVEFSPWMYRQEQSLLLPLLATLAKKRPVFQKIVSEIANAGPG